MGSLCGAAVGTVPKSISASIRVPSRDLIRSLANHRDPGYGVPFVSKGGLEGGHEPRTKVPKVVLDHLIMYSWNETHVFDTNGFPYPVPHRDLPNSVILSVWDHTKKRSLLQETETMSFSEAMFYQNSSSTFQVVSSETLTQGSMRFWLFISQTQQYASPTQNAGGAFIIVLFDFRNLINYSWTPCCNNICRAL